MVSGVGSVGYERGAKGGGDDGEGGGGAEVSVTAVV